MTFDRVGVVEDALDALLAGLTPAATALRPHDSLRPGGALTAHQAVALFEDQVMSRQIDVAARHLKKTNLSFTRSVGQATRTTRSSVPSSASPTPASCTTARAGS